MSATAVMTMRVTPEQRTLITDVAASFGKSASDFMRDAVMERIEDELDVQAYERGMAAYRANPVTHSNGDVLKEFGLA